MRQMIKKGFTLVEILVVLLIIGIMAAVVVPNFQGRRPRDVREQFIRRLNETIRFGWQHAIATGKNHRVHFDFKQRRVQVQMDTGQKDRKGELLFVGVPGTYVTRSVEMPQQLQIKNFIIEGHDEFKGGTQKKEVWFFLVPDGLSQAVIINMVDKKDVLSSEKPRPVGLVLNPFSAQFKIYDTFQK